MSDDEEKRCPLCAEEMDWTDQQLKPCKCGYQVCVWCWNHIMDMTEKYETGGRCPACRTPYDKEKVAGMEAKFERVVSNNSNRKQKQAKAKPKTNEARKDLSNVRVIQRKIAYVIGLPLSLADEDLLQRKEYFGQYGKITKVSLSRTAGGAVQQFINDTCSVYVTYSKEEEAVRCIQYVHGFLLEGRFLRASFGTAKYCHAWLRNVPCNNPACLYLHTMGAEEDSFGKDEVAAVHTRNRLQQIVGDSHNSQNRSGNVLPPPIDYWNDSSENPAVKSGPKDFAIDTVNSNDQLISSSSFKDKNGGIATPCKTTTFVDIVARSCSSGSDKDGNVDEDRVFNLCSQSSSVSIDEDYNNEAKRSNEMPSEVSSYSHLVNGLPSNSEFKEPFRGQSHLMVNCGREVPHEPRVDLMEDLLSFDDQSSKDNDSLSDLNADCNIVNTSANSIPSDGYNEGKFQSSAKSDKIYRCSMFSNEEIVEHLRRLDEDNDDMTNGENSALDAVKSSIISNIMSLDLDTFDELSALPHSSAGLFNETSGLQGSSWNFVNSDQSSRFSFAKTEGSSSQLTDLDSSFSSISRELKRGSVLQHSRENKEHYSCKPVYNVSRAQGLIPPGFSLPSREPPPGFPERTDQVIRSTSGNLSVKTSLANNHFRTPSGGTMSVTTDVDLIDPAIMHVLRGKTTNGSSNSCLDMRSHYASQTSSVEDEARQWHLMQQSAPRGQQVPKFPQTYSQQIPVHQDPRFSSWDDIYGFSSRPMNQQRTYNQSSFTEFSQQKFGLGHISNGCHQPSLDEMQHNRNEVGMGMGEVQRNEALGGLNRLLPGYGDHVFQMPSSGDIYARVFGM